MIQKIKTQYRILKIPEIAQLNQVNLIMIKSINKSAI